MHCCAKLLQRFLLLLQGSCDGVRHIRVSPAAAFVCFCCVVLSVWQLQRLGAASAGSSTTGGQYRCRRGPSLKLPIGQRTSQAADIREGCSERHFGRRTVAAANENSSLLKLGPGDLIEVNVYNVPELTTKARVGNSGDVYLPLIDYVHVDGLTQEEAQAVIEKRLEDGGFVRNPHVTIFVDEAASQGVTILGEVAKPGIYPDAWRSQTL